MIKRASDTVASLKPTASTVAATAAANKTGSPPPPDSAGRRSGRGAQVEDTSTSIVMETGADSDDGEGEAEGEGAKGSGTASREGDAHERDGNDADDESGSELSADEERDDCGEAGGIEDVVMGDQEEVHTGAVVVVRESGGFSGANSHANE